jgi:choline-glycine betaine transporter
MIAAGLAGGLIYWAIAGWSAGFWKPVFSQPPQPQTSASA